MEIVFTTNEKFWSKVFRWLSEEPVSHLAFRFTLNGVNLTVDCSTEGGRLMTWDKFKSANFPLLTIQLETDETLEWELFNRALSLVGKKYDFGAYIYALWRGLLRRVLRIPLPRINPYSSSNLFACTEIFLPTMDILQREFDISFDGIDLAMQSPLMIYERLKRGNDDDQTDYKR